MDYRFDPLTPTDSLDHTFDFSCALKQGDTIVYANVFGSNGLFANNTTITANATAVTSTISNVPLGQQTISCQIATASGQAQTRTAKVLCLVTVQS